jgi:hypothetical protein
VYSEQAEDDAKALVLDAIAIGTLPAKTERDEHEQLGGSSWRISSVLGSQALLARAYDALQAQQEVHRAARLNLSIYLKKRARHLKDSGEPALKPAKIRELMKESETTPLGLPKKGTAVVRSQAHQSQASAALRRGAGIFADAVASIDARQKAASKAAERMELLRRLAELDAGD